MKTLSPHDSDATNELIQEAVQGDSASLGKLLAEHRPRLRRMVAMRMDPRLAGRVDPSDIVQEGQLEAARRLGDFIREPKAPFFLWLRFITGQCLAACHRRHLGAQQRDVRRELSVDQPRIPEASSVALAHQLLGRMSSPSQAAIREEQKAKLHEALDTMDPADREVLALRHFERLTAGEAAAELGISESAAKKRYLRALERLRSIMSSSLGWDRHE
jgi:RNA polymerase sigma-70 factor (ECF subfamily)